MNSIYHNSRRASCLILLYLFLFCLKLPLIFCFQAKATDPAKILAFAASVVDPIYLAKTKGSNHAQKSSF